MRVVVLTGGVGGARFLCGLADTVDPADITAVVNVGDDVEVLGLCVSPDLDSVLYALAGLADEERGWGRAHETWNALATVESSLSAPSLVNAVTVKYQTPGDSPSITLFTTPALATVTTVESAVGLLPYRTR